MPDEIRAQVLFLHDSLYNDLPAKDAVLQQALKIKIQDKDPFVNAYLDMRKYLDKARQAFERGLMPWHNADSETLAAIIRKNQREFSALKTALSNAHQTANLAGDILEQRLDKKFPGAYPKNLGNSFHDSAALGKTMTQIIDTATSATPPPDREESMQREEIFDAMDKTPERRLQNAFLPLIGTLADAKGAVETIDKLLPPEVPPAERTH